MRDHRTLRVFLFATLCFGLGLTHSAHARHVLYQTADVHDLATGEALGGAGTLFRKRESVHARIATSGLDANSAYTVWWVVFNRPRRCVDGCGLDDLANPQAGPSVFYATGFLTGGDGTANVTADLRTGVLPFGIDVLLGNGLGRGNGYRAEIHLVIRTHGPVVPGRVDEQIGSFDGVCELNSCADQQAVAFLPRFLLEDDDGDDADGDG